MKYNEEKLRKIISESNSLTESVEKLGLNPFCGNRNTLKKYIKKYNISVEHFGDYRYKEPSNKKELSDVLVENSTYTHTTKLKDRLYKEGIKEPKCEKCGQDEIWLGKKMSLILDHINGIHDDNRIENLQILCPNCNATLDTHGGKNIKLKPKKTPKRKTNGSVCVECGARKKTKRGDYCEKCSQEKQRTVVRPSQQQLLNEIEETSYSAVGRKYGVSDNSIRKWVKAYEK